MRKTTIPLTLLLAAAFAMPAIAGKSSSSRFSGSHAASKIKAGASSSSSTSRNRSYKRLGSNTRAKQQQRSLIANNGPQPSPKVTQIIRERESSAPGWLGTAFLVAMLSRHDLSNSDRSWIQGRINAIRSDEETSGLIPPTNPKIDFTFKGLDTPIFVGEAAQVSVSAFARGQALSVSCDHPAATIQNGRINIEWTPHEPGVFLLACKAGEQQERRLVRVIAKEAS